MSLLADVCISEQACRAAMADYKPVAKHSRATFLTGPGMHLCNIRQAAQAEMASSGLTQLAFGEVGHLVET